MLKTISISEILSAYELLNNFIQKDVSMPSKLTWIISDNMDSLEKVVDKFHKKQNQIGQRFISEGKTTKNKDGNDIILTEFIPEYTSYIREILDITREIDIELINLEDLKQIDQLSVMDIKALSFMTERQDNTNEKNCIG